VKKRFLIRKITRKIVINKASFFITETDSERKANDTENTKKIIKPPLPNIMDVLSDSKAREAVLSTNKKDIDKYPSIKEKSLVNPNFTKENHDIEPTTLNRDFSRLSNTTDLNRKKRECGLSDIKNAAEGLKQEMVVQNRCNICTLKIPCKHYSTDEEMQNAIIVQKKKSLITEISNQPSILPPLPRIQSMGIPKRASLPGGKTEIIPNFTEQNSSFHSNYLGRDQISIFKDSVTEHKMSRASKTNMRMAPNNDSSCTIRIRSKNIIETYKGNVKRTISEHRGTRNQKSKLKEAK